MTQSRAIADGPRRKRPHVERTKIRQPIRRAAVGLLAGVVTLTGVNALAQPAQAQHTPVAPLADAGTVVGWGPDVDYNGVTLPPGRLSAAQQNTAFTQVVPGGPGGGLGLTAAGDVEVIGTPLTGLEGVHDFPAGLNDQPIKQIAGTPQGQALAVTDDGRVRAWGDFENSWPPGYDSAAAVPAGLTSVVSADIASNGRWAAAVKADGTVDAWGSDPAHAGYLTGAEALTGVKSLALGGFFGFALKSNGTVVGFGQNLNGTLDLPASVTAPGNVLAVAARNQGGIALLADQTVVGWGTKTAPGEDNAIPAGLDDVVAIDALPQSNVNVAVDKMGDVQVWGTPANIDGYEPEPASLAGADVASISIGRGLLALVTKVLEVTKPTVANGTAIPGATGATLALSPSLAGKRITYRSTATKGAETATSDSSATAPVLSAKAPASASRTSVAISPTDGDYGARRDLVVTVGRVSGGTATGNVTINVDGDARTHALAGGKTTFALSRKLRAGNHTVSVSYAGDATTVGSSTTATVSVDKVHSKTRAKVKLRKKGRKHHRHLKRVDLKLKVKTDTGVRPKGKVKIEIKRGKHTVYKKNVRVNRHGKATVKINKLNKRLGLNKHHGKRKFTVKVTYRGNHDIRRSRDRAHFRA
jgi:hypothetical protein